MCLKPDSAPIRSETRMSLALRAILKLAATLETVCMGPENREYEVARVGVVRSEKQPAFGPTHQRNVLWEFAKCPSSPNGA